MKQNCWEFKNCGRHEGGKHSDDLGVCPATRDTRLDGIHGGTNAGRACWIIAGTLCKGEVQGSFAKKYKHCEQCNFYQEVRKDEGGKFILSAVLINKMKN